MLFLDVPLASVRERELVAALARRAPEVLATAPRGDARTIAQLEAALGCAAEAARPRRRSGSLGALQEHLFEDSTPPRAGLDETVTLRSWPGEAREAVEIARGRRTPSRAGSRPSPTCCRPRRQPSPSTISSRPIPTRPRWSPAACARRGAGSASSSTRR